MKKTIEEMKAAVLAELERLCPKPCSEWLGGEFRVTAWQDKWSRMWELYIRDRRGEWQTIFTMYDASENTHAVSMFYLALGLEARDKVEAKDKEIEALKTNHQGTKDALERKQKSAKEMSDMYLALKAQAAALVAALEGAINVRRDLQISLDHYGDAYQLKTDDEMIEIVSNFGFGETEFHTADIDRLLTQINLVSKALEAHKKGGKNG